MKTIIQFDPYHKRLFISSADQPPNHYQLLGLNLFESNPDVIDVATEQRVVYLRLSHRLLCTLFWIWALVSPSSSQAQSKISWNESSLTLIHAHAGYGRMARLKDGQIICCFESGGKVWVRRSSDNGAAWQSPTLVADYQFGAATNPEILPLTNGSLLCCYNERPKDGMHPYSIMVSFSSDRGQTWTSPRRVYEADRVFENGCWEPAAIQLASGEIQLFFANENPYRTTAEQEITLLRSSDIGKTWVAPQRISFRKDRRDGMPVPLVLNGKKGIVFAIEDNEIGEFKPAIIYTSTTENWKGTVDGGSARRWSALKEPLAPGVYAGAPYIRQMPSGETVLSVQSKEGGRREPRMVVYVGDEWARGFSGKSIPFDVPDGTACLWNSLFVKDDDTVVTIAGTTQKNVFGLWSIEGRLVRETKAIKPGTDVIQIWRHRVDGGATQIHRFYSNGKINNPNGSAVWSISGRVLTMKWPGDKAPGGAWIDRCNLSEDRRSYSGTNQGGNKITGELSQSQN